VTRESGFSQSVRPSWRAYASAALQGLLVMPDPPNENENWEPLSRAELVEVACLYADEMVREEAQRFDSPLEQRDDG
jgi:hypothetical protein